MQLLVAVLYLAAILLPVELEVILSGISFMHHKRKNYERGDGWSVAEVFARV